MAKDYIESLRLGKRGELYVFDELLRRRVIPYVPLVDVEGVDCIIRKAGGGFLEVQVKTINTPAQPRWWQATDVPDRDDYYLVLVGQEPFANNTWILTGRVFREHATRSGETFDLNLDAAKRGTDRPRADALTEYQGRWELLVTPAAIEASGETESQ